MRVLAVDPGLRSGWSHWLNPHGGWGAGICDPMPMIDLAELVLGQRGADLVVCEAFKITQRTAQLSAQHWSIELIGALRWLCHKYGVPFVLQTPAEAKTFCPDARLRDLGMWTPGREDHHRDATRHLVLALAKRGELAVSPLGE